jgi:hypothetical protein
MPALCFLLIGVAVIAAIAGWVVYHERTSTSRVAAQLARLEALKAERQLQAITQQAVNQLLAAARLHQ